MSRLTPLAAALALALAPAARGQFNPFNYPSLGAIIAGGAVTLNTDTLTVSGAPGTSGSGVAVAQPGGPVVAVFDFSSISFNPGGTLAITGSRPVAVLCQSNATIPSLVAVSPTGVVGGFAGGRATSPDPASRVLAIQAGQGPGAGQVSIDHGAGGGGYGGAGGAPYGGQPYGGLPGVVQGGSGGGATSNTGLVNAGGAGGGGIALVAVLDLTVGNINVNGTNGSAGSNGNAGGGSGGTILLSGGTGLRVNGALTANGGNGSGAEATGNGGGGGGGGGRIMLGGLGSYTLGSSPLLIGGSVSASGGTGSFAGNGAGGDITVDALSTLVPQGTSVTLDGRPVPSAFGNQTQPAIEALIRHDLVVNGTATLGTSEALRRLDTGLPGPGSQNVTSLTVNGTFDLNGYSQTVDTLSNTVLFPSAVVRIPAGSTLTVGAGHGSGTYYGSLGGTGAVVKVGTGALTLAGLSTFSGTITVTGGSLTLAHDQALLSATVAPASGASVSFASPAANPVVGALAGTGTVSLNGISTLTVGNNGLSTTFAGDFFGSAGLVKTGFGILTLAGWNPAFSGPTSVRQGVLSIAHDLALQYSTVSLDGGSVKFGTGNPVLGGLAGTGSLDLTGTTAVTVGENSASTTWSGGPAGSGTLIKSGLGTLTLNAASFSTTPVTVAGGTLALGNNQVLQNNTVTLARGALAFTTAAPVLGALAGTSNLSLAGLTGLTVGGNNASTTFAGNLSDSASGGLTKAGSGTWTLAGTNTQAGPFTVQAGTVLAGSAGALSANAPVTVAAGATLDLNGYNYAVTAANPLTARGDLRLGGAGVTVASGVTATYNGGTVSNGFLRGPGTHLLTGGAALSGVTTFGSTLVNQTGPAAVTNFANGGAFNNAAGQTLTWSGSTNTPGGQLTVNGTVNASDFVSTGVVAVNPGGVVNNSVSDLVLGGGSVTTIGLYNPSTGAVTRGGTVSLGATNLVIRGGLVRNNGTITSTTGNVVVDFGGVLRGSGTFDVNQVVLQNGGVRVSGNSPGLSPNRSVDFVNTGTLASDMSNAAGLPGSGDPAGFSGWGVYEYGATPSTRNGGGRATITGTPASPALFRMATVTDAAPRSNPSTGLVNNFDPAQPYSWVVLRPGTEAGLNLSGGAADPAKYTDFTTVNTADRINIHDSLLNLDVPLTNASLNAYLHFDDSQWNWGTTPAAQRGAFAFALMPDTLGNADRVIGLTYTPVPEPALGLAVAALGVGAIAAIRLWRTETQV